MTGQRLAAGTSQRPAVRPDEGATRPGADGVRIEVRRDDLHDARAVDLDLPGLADGQVRLRVDRFALSANNATYARLGDSIGYWRFYPAAPGWGCVPAWGIAEVTESRCAGVPAGRLASGLLPMASQVVMSPGRVSSGGFDESAAHRRDLPRLYNVYRFVTQAGRDQDMRMVLQPSFWLSFLLADFLDANGCFGASAVVISSASSKSALGLGFLLRGRLRTVGLTATSRKRDVADLGLYDEVLSYDDIGSLAVEPAALIDLTGSTQILAAVHERLGSRLLHSSLAGTTHGTVTHGEGGQELRGLPGPHPQLFFVPDYLRARARESGMDVVAARFDAALAHFGQWSAPWLGLPPCSTPTGASFPARPRWRPRSSAACPNTRRIHRLGPDQDHLRVAALPSSGGSLPARSLAAALSAAFFGPPGCHATTPSAPSGTAVVGVVLVQV
jgi:hypothetical protein